MRGPISNVDGKRPRQTDSVMVEAMIYPGDKSNDDPVVTIHPLKTKDGVLVKVEPPSGPSDGAVPHVPCDIVLVIDVSGSMSTIAPPPGGGKDANGNTINETCDLSVLDLTKHAARTILSTLNESDRLAIVTFSSGVEVVQTLAPMTPENKKQIDAKLNTIKATDMTNLWGGISEGLKQLPEDVNGRVPALMVLTDGQPNFLCPNQGYVKKLRTLSYQTATTINTFGFGYDIRSGLLRSIAEVSNGNFLFIPDAGMIGTVFVHAIAHLQTTYATGAVLQIEAPKGVLLNTTTGHSIDRPNDKKTGLETINIPLGNLQYGQSRDIYLEIVDASGRQTEFDVLRDGVKMSVQLTYSRMQSPHYAVLADHDMSHTTLLPQSVIDYHRSRSMICRFLLSRFPIQNFEYKDDPALARKVTDSTMAGMESFKRDLQTLIENIPARLHEDDHNQSLMADLSGQIREGLDSQESLRRWGRHYFYSLGNAHSKQLCNSFKDPGPLMYNHDPFFVRCRDALDNAFDNLPPPEPTETTPDRGWHPRAMHLSGTSSKGFRSRVSMRSYNDARAVCFTGSTLVTLCAGSGLPIRELRRGMTVRTPMGPRGVRALVETMVEEMTMYRVGDAVATPWHPVKIGEGVGDDQNDGWVYPVDVAQETVKYSGPIYSVMLETDTNPDAHAISVGGVWAVTLGHGITCGDDLRAHKFYGDRDAVYKALLTVSDRDQTGIYYVNAPLRDDKGEVVGFTPAP